MVLFPAKVQSNEPQSYNPSIGIALGVGGGGLFDSGAFLEYRAGHMAVPALFKTMEIMQQSIVAEKLRTTKPDI